MLSARSAGRRVDHATASPPASPAVALPFTMDENRSALKFNTRADPWGESGPRSREGRCVRTVFVRTA